MKYYIFIFVFIFHIYPSWAREPLLTDVVDKDINITASFDGAKIVIYGAIDTKLHKDSILIINVLGPSSHLKIRKKEDERSVIVKPTLKADKLMPLVATIQKKVSCQTGLTNEEYIALRQSTVELLNNIDKNSESNNDFKIA